MSTQKLPFQSLATLNRNSRAATTEETRLNPYCPSDTDSAARWLENDLNNEGPPSDEEGLSGEESTIALVMLYSVQSNFSSC